jgi:hypothetical protein
MTWGFIWMIVVLKIPIVAMLWLVWWAVRAEPEPAAAGDQGEGGGGTGHSPRPPRRGAHAEPAPQPPPRIRAISRTGSVPHE